MNAIAQAINVVGSATRLAKILNVSVQAVCFWRDGKRSVPANRCLAIERATNGQVTRAELRADAHEIWPDVPQPQDHMEAS